MAIAANSSMYGDPSFDIVRESGTTVSMTNQDTDYPAENIRDNDPGTPAKSTTTSTTVTVTPPASRTIVAAFVFGTNASSISVNGNAMVVPGRDLELQWVNPWEEYTTPITAGSFTIALSKGAGAVLWVGEIFLIEEDGFLPCNLRPSLQFGRERPGLVETETRLGKKHTWVPGIRCNVADGQVELGSDLDRMVQLEMQSGGLRQPFPFVPYRDQNYAWCVNFTSSSIRWRARHEGGAVTSFPVVVRELSQSVIPT